MSTLKLNKPDKTKLALDLGMRFVDRKGRYILQAQTTIIVRYEPHTPTHANDSVTQVPVMERTWIDVPLVVETYT